MTLNGLVEPFGSTSLSISPTASPCSPPYENVVEMAWASSQGLKVPLESSGLFNPDDPDLSSCISADNIIKTESDQYLTVDVSELFPDLMDLDEVSSPAPDNKPVAAVGELDLRFVSGEASSAEEVSPAETDASLDHFFNTFTDLTGFLENLSEETGPTNLDVNSAVLAGNDNATDNTAAPSIGSDLCTSAEEPAETEELLPSAKRACKSQAPSRKRQTYRERRDKNNFASRRSRASRKHKFSGMEARAMELETENEHLLKKIEELTEIAEMSRKCLIKALQNK